VKVRLEDVELGGKRVFWGPRFAKAVKVDHSEKGCWAESVQVPVESSRVESSAHTLPASKWLNSRLLRIPRAVNG